MENEFINDIENILKKYYQSYVEFSDSARELYDNLENEYIKLKANE